MRLITAWVVLSYALVVLAVIAMGIHDLLAWFRGRRAIRQLLESLEADARPDPMELLSLGRDPEESA